MGYLLSVIIPVFNTAKTLDACLKSVLRQDYQDLELLCVDDGSTDNSLEILRKYRQRDERVKIFHHDRNMGRLSARKTGINNAEGDYILFVDSDDTIDQTLCSCVIDLIRKNNVDILQFSARQVDIVNDKTELILPPNKLLRKNEILNIYYITREAPTSLALKIYRRDVCRKAFDQIPNIRCYAGEDVLASFFIAYYASSYAGVNTKPKYTYYLGRGITSSDGSVSLEKYEKYCEMSRFPAIISDFLQREHAGEFVVKAAEHMVVRLLSDCCYLYANISDEDKDDAVEIFWNNWREVDDFPRIMMDAFTLQKNYSDLIYSSESYKLGNGIVSRFRGLKSMFFSGK